MAYDRRRASPRAMTLGRYPSSAAAARTRSRVSAATRALGCPPSTSDTVGWENPARAATSRTVIRRVMERRDFAGGICKYVLAGRQYALANRFCQGERSIGLLRGSGW